MKPCVLIVDDDASVRSGLAANLEEEGFEPCTAASGADALQVLAARRVDLVLADLVMDGMDGLALLRRLADEQSGLPVVVLTGHGTPANAVEALREGAADFIQKPAQPSDIAGRIKAILDAQRLRTRLLSERDTARTRDREDEARRDRDSRMAVLRRFCQGLDQMLGTCIEDLQRTVPVLTGEVRDHPALARSVETVSRAANRLGEVSYRLKQLAHGETAARGAIDLNALVGDVLEDRALVSGGRCNLQLAKALPPVSGQEARVRRAVRRLVETALDGLPDEARITVETVVGGFDRDTVHIGSPPAGPCVQIRVREPRSLTREQADAVFEPFYADLSLRRPSNGGFGLTVAHLVAEAHGGAVSVSSDRGGTLWTLTLPVAGKPTPEADPTEPRDERFRPMHVLVVDDQEEYRAEAARLLGELGCRVSLVAGATEALSAIGPGETPGAGIDLVLLDLVLGDAHDGVDLFLQMRTHREDLKVILIGGFTETDRVTEARRMGVCDYLQKPLTAEALRRALSRV